MPITFAPAQPFNAQISQGFGKTEQWNKFFPTLASMYESQARNATQAGIATGEINARNAQQSAANANRGAEMEFQANEQRHAQVRQIQAQRENQQREQAFDWAVQGAKVGQQDLMREQQMNAGLAQLNQDVQDGLLSKEDAADSAFFLRTNIDRTQMRARSQDAQLKQARGQQEMEESARKAAITKSHLALFAKDGDSLVSTQKFADGTEGKLYVSGTDASGTPTFAQWKDSTEKAKPAPFETKTGEFDLGAAFKDAKTRAEADPAFFESKDGGARKMTAAGHEWIAARTEGLERQFNERKAAGPQQTEQAAVQGIRAATQPQEQQPRPPQGPDVERILANPKLDEVEKRAAMEAVGWVQNLKAKPLTAITNEDRQRLAEYKKLLTAALQ